jgi:tetratricopeptide (TPR) repeat protein
MKVKAIWLVFGIICLSLTAFSQTPAELIQEADVLFEDMQDMDTAQRALSLYRKALVDAVDKYEAYWKIARVMYYIGEHQEKKKDRKNTFAQAVYHCDKAVELGPEKPDGYYWRAVNNGKYGETRGVLKSLSLVKPIKRDLNKVIELNRSYEDGGPDRVMGRVYFKLPGFAGGSKDKSLEHLEKSKGYGPEDVVTRLYLAETLLDHKRIEDARAELEYILNVPDDPHWVAAIQENKAAAQELLKHKKFRKK